MTDEAIFESFITHLVYSPDDLILDENSYSQFLTENAGWVSSAKELMTSLTNEHPDVIFVAAAGNSNLPYPYLPASLDSVISVSSVGEDASRPCVNKLYGNSNCGEVEMDGVYFGDSNIKGTSIAAPRFTFSIASYLAGEGGCPPDIFNYSLESANGPWENRPYSCP